MERWDKDEYEDSVRLDSGWDSEGSDESEYMESPTGEASNTANSMFIEEGSEDGSMLSLWNDAGDEELDAYFEEPVSVEVGGVNIGMFQGKGFLGVDAVIEDNDTLDSEDDDKEHDAIMDHWAVYGADEGIQVDTIVGDHPAEAHGTMEEDGVMGAYGVMI